MRKFTSARFIAALLSSFAGGVISLVAASPASATSYTDWGTVSVGDQHICAIRVGRLYCWGNDTYGQLGNGSGGSTTTPHQITTATDWKSVSAGYRHSCAIRSTGKLYCWGSDTNGQLGNGSGGSSQVAIQITTATDWKSVSAGAGHTCAIRSTGKLYCWGDDLWAQLGNGSGGSSQVAVQITTATDWKTISAGDTYTCAIRGTGRLYCWGNLVGNEDDVHGGQQTPTLDTSAYDWTATGVALNDTCALRVGKLYCRGYFYDPDHFAINDYSKQVTSATDWKSLSVRSRRGCGIRGTGKLYCWTFTNDAAGTTSPAQV